MWRPGVLAAALLVAGLTVAVGWPSLRYDFVYDDEAVVVERKPFWELGLPAFLASRPHGTGRHVAAVSLDLDRLEAGTVPGPFHRTNLALAALLSVLVLFLALRLGLSTMAATAAAALFAVHPVHVDSVAWIVGRSELLSALGVLAAMLACLRPAREGTGPGPWRIGAATALFAFVAVHSKENALCLPLLLVAARILLGPRVAWLPGLGGSGVAIASWMILVAPLVSTLKQPQFVDNPLVYAPIFERIPKALAILWQYAGLLVWPHPLLPDRAWAATDPGLAEGWLAAAAWVAVAAGAWRLRSRYPRAVFALAWFPVAFAVTANVGRPIGILMAERLLLLPSVSACLLAGLAFEALAVTAARRRAALLAVAVVVAVFFGLFRQRTAIWENGDVYFAASAAASPASAKAQYDYGAWLLRRKDRPAAEAALARALAIVPSFSRAASLRAESMAARGDPGGGAEVYLAYLAQRPEDDGAVKNVTRLLLKADRPEEALPWARRFLELRPDDQEAIGVLVIVEAALRRKHAEESAARGASTPGQAPPVSP